MKTKIIVTVIIKIIIIVMINIIIANTVMGTIKIIIIFNNYFILSMEMVLIQDHITLD